MLPFDFIVAYMLTLVYSNNLMLKTIAFCIHKFTENFQEDCKNGKIQYIVMTGIVFWLR